MSNRLEALTIIRHLKDVNNLGVHGTDSPLEPGQESTASEVGRKLYEEAKKDGFQGILFISSPKTRAIETANIMRKNISDINVVFKTGLAVDPNIRELDQGKFRLPPDYIPGTYFMPLKKAWTAFWGETFTNHNPLYRFGSANAEGQLKYPELVDHFEHPGECYKDQAIRLYSSVYEMGKSLDKFHRVKPVVIAHGAPLAIFRELEQIAKDVQNGVIDIPVGGLVQLSWDYFERRTQDQHPDYGQLSQISLSALYDPMILGILKREIDYLRQL